MRLRYLALCFLLTGCHLFHKHSISVDPSPVATSTAMVNDASTKVIDKAAGFNEGEQVLLPKFPDSILKTAMTQLVQGQAVVLGAPTAATKDDFDKLALALISQGKTLSDAQAKLTEETGQAATLKQQLADAKVAQATEIANLKNQHALDLANAKADADRKVKEIVSYIFFGIAGLCLIGALLVATLASAYPLFGPKAALSLGIGGVISGACGVGIIKLLDVSLVYWGVGAGVLAIGVACTLIFGNHAHAQADTNVPAKL